MGVKAGINLSDIVMTNYVNPDVEADLNIKSGLHAGFFISGELADRVGMAAELMYSNKGVKGNEVIHLHYVALPLMARYKLNESFSLELGPEPAYLFSARSRHGDVSSTYTNRFDLSLDGGVQFEAQRILLNLRYCVGLFSVRDPIEFQNLAGPDKIKYQNRVLQFSVGWRLFELE